MSTLLHPRKRFQTDIVEIKNLSPTVKKFCISVPSDFVFSPGQFVNCKIKKNGKKIARSYSIANNKLDKGLELCIKYVENGICTPYLFECNVGAKMDIVGPMGKFIVLDDLFSNDICFIATGTGIAPFRAMINSLFEDKTYIRKISLIFGVRYVEELLYLEEWEDLKKKYNDRFNFFPCVSKLVQNANDNDANKQFFSGRVDALLKERISYYGKYHFFICGLSDMVDGVVAICNKNSISEKNIHFEKYD